jgi:hypothetical protein
MEFMGGSVAGNMRASKWILASGSASSEQVSTYSERERVERVAVEEGFRGLPRMKNPRQRRCRGFVSIA